MSENCDTRSEYSYNQGNIYMTIFSTARLPALFQQRECQIKYQSHYFPICDFPYTGNTKHLYIRDKITNSFHKNHNKTLTGNNGTVYKI